MSKIFVFNLHIYLQVKKELCFDILSSYCLDKFQHQNTGFSPVTDLNKDCSLIRMVRLNVCQGICSSVRLDTDIFIGTSSVLNRQNLKTLFLQILVIKMIFSRKVGGIHFFSSTCGQNMSLYGQKLLPEQLLQVPTCLLRPRPYLKTARACFFLNQKLRLLKIFIF